MAQLAVINANPALAHQVRWAKAVHSGLKRHGVSARVTDDPKERGDVNIINGPWFSYTNFYGKPNVLMIDRAYWGDPDWVSMGWLKPDGSRNFKNANSPADRWDQHGPILEDWTDVGIPVVFGDYKEDRKNIEYVINRTGSWYRPHPQAPDWPDCPTRVVRGPLDELLESCGTAIGWKSTVLVEAVIKGIPVITLDANNVVWDVAGHRLDQEAPAPDREQWANDLAYAQWDERDIKSGLFWEHLKP